MVTQKIKFTSNGETKEIGILGLYPYLVNPSQNKTVLRISAKEDTASFEDFELLKNVDSGIIEHWSRPEILKENGKGSGRFSKKWVLTKVYEDYDTGEIAVTYNKKGIFQCDVTRMDALQKTAEQNVADVEYLAAMTDISLE